MCRNIRPLFNFEPPATDAEIEAAAEQFVRKISGFQKPSQINQPAFDAAVAAISAASMRLLTDLQTSASPRNREEESAKLKARSARRFAS